jgi:hypothetical protein
MRKVSRVMNCLKRIKLVAIIVSTGGAPVPIVCALVRLPDVFTFSNHFAAEYLLSLCILQALFE